MYRHIYGMKLAEMHVDDWTIARLLGHRSLRNVKYYRKMSNKILADDTRKQETDYLRWYWNVWKDGRKNMNKYDSMIACNKKASEEKVNRAVDRNQADADRTGKSDGPKTDKEDRIVQRILL